MFRTCNRKPPTFDFERMSMLQLRSKIKHGCMIGQTGNTFGSILAPRGNHTHSDREANLLGQ